MGSETASPNIKARKESDAEVEIVNSLNQAASPLEGVEFTYEEFADALSKYDFSFEIGDTVSTPDMLSYICRISFDSVHFVIWLQFGVKKIKNFIFWQLLEPFFPSSLKLGMGIQIPRREKLMYICMLLFAVIWSRCQNVVLKVEDCPICWTICCIH